MLQLYTGEGFDFSLPRAALKEKGFSRLPLVESPPPPAQLREMLEEGVSAVDHQRRDAEAQRRAHQGHQGVLRQRASGVYLWGDNEPYYADANQVAQALFGTKMLGNVPGDQTVSLWPKPGVHGVLPNHLLTTGLHYLYEGITIATIQPNQVLKPLVYGHADNLVAAYYDADGKRAILDGGFTRLYYKWDTAGTGALREERRRLARERRALRPPKWRR